MDKKVLTPALFEPAEISSDDKNRLNIERVGYWKDAIRRFRSSKLAVVGLVIILLFLILSFVIPMISHYDYQTQNLDIQNREAFGDHYFGTDNFGRDIWTRTWYGAKISLEIAFLATAIALLIGVTVGGVSGYFGGRVDMVLQRLIEILVGIPDLIIIILLLLIFEPGIVPIALALAITSWVPMARVVRAQIFKLRSQEYVLAARTLGASHTRILLKHLIPNVMGPIIIAVTFAIPTAIFFEAFLSFIGLGIQPPLASLGSLINEGGKYLQMYPYQIVYPAAILSLIMLSFSTVGDALRDALDPRMRK